MDCFVALLSCANGSRLSRAMTVARIIAGSQGTFRFPLCYRAMAKSDTKPGAPNKKSGAKKSSELDATSSDSEQKSEFVEVTAEGDEHVEPPPPEVVEPDPELSPEEAEQARKDYLLTRFWISARGYWGRNGDRLAWAFSIGLLFLIVANVGFQYGINVWNRA